MSVFRSVRFAVLLVVGGAAMAAAQQQMPPMPKPGPEHDILNMDAGTWEAVVEVTPAPGAPVMKSTGVEVSTMGCGGLCLITDFKGEMMGTPFLGHGVTTWDPAKKKYVGSWTDSMSTGLSIGESTYDPATKKWSGWMEGPDMTGKVMKSRPSSSGRTPRRASSRCIAAGPDGKEMEGMKITYTKRK